MHYPARYWLALISLATAGCVRAPESYPAPEQHFSFGSGGVTPADFVQLDHPGIAKSVLQDIYVDDTGPWRWTGADPELKFELSRGSARALLIDFAISDRTFRDTGPVTISFYVNGHLAGQERYTSFGDKSFEKPIPDDWVQERPETRVRLHIDPVWPSPGGRALGILLKRVGFAE